MPPPKKTEQKQKQQQSKQTNKTPKNLADVVLLVLGRLLILAKYRV